MTTAPTVVEPWETGYKDTVIAYPGQITTVKAMFDIVGLYVWHCHIVEHEDNEMMRPYIVSRASLRIDPGEPIPCNREKAARLGGLFLGRLPAAPADGE